MDILKIKDSQGNWKAVPALVGPQGEQGVQGEKGDRGDTVIIAKDYADLTFPVYAGKTYCYHDNKPYVAKTDIATTEAWTAAHWNEVSFEDEISELRSAFQSSNYLDIIGTWDKKAQNLNYSVWKNGIYASSTGNFSANNGYLATEDFLPDEVEYIVADSGYTFSVSIWESNGTYVHRDDESSTYSFYVLSHLAGRKYKVNLKKSDGSTIAADDARHVFFGNLLYSNTPEIEYGFVNVGGSFAINQYGHNIITRDFVTSYGIKINKSIFNKICLVNYSQDGTFVSRSASFFASPEYYILPNDGYKHKVAFIKNDTTIYPEDIEGNIAFFEKTWQAPLEYGFISQSNGALTNNDTAVRSSDYVPINVNTVTPNGGAKIAVARYQNGAFVSRSNFQATPYLFNHDSGMQFKILIQKSDDSVILPDEIDGLVDYEVKGENGIIWAKGLISVSGTPVYDANIYYTYDFIDPSIIGIDIKALDCAISVAVYSTEGVFESRTSFAIKPYYAFDHKNHKYRVNFNNYTPATAKDTEKVRFIKNSLFSNVVIGRMVGVSDMTRYISGDGVNVAYDAARGMCYTVYEGSTGEYGESYFNVRLSVYPIDQPFKAEYYDIILAGQTSGDLTFVGTNDINIMDVGDAVRVFFYEQGTKMQWYIDFDKETHTKSNAQKMYIKIGNADPVEYSNANMRQYYEDNNLTLPTTAWVEFNSNVIKDGDYYVSTITFGYTSYPIIVRSTDGAVWELMYRIDHRCEYEAPITKLGTDYYVTLRIDKTYIIPDDFSSITVIEGNGNYLAQGNTRPEIITYGDEVVVGVSENGVFAGNNYVSGTRKQITFYKGAGSDLTKYKPLFSIIHKDGICSYRLINVNGIVYLLTSLGHLYYTKHPNSSACKDGIYSGQIGDLTLIENMV